MLSDILPKRHLPQKLKRQSDMLELKHQSIIALWDLLRNKTIIDESHLVDHWDGDRCAIGIKAGQKLMYISTFAHLDRVPILYHYEVEEVDVQGNTIRTLTQRSDADESQILSAVKSVLAQ